jgi:NAD(P)-dependent dehydrogenase (short-subunit alcohol dehydrogenase family)
MIADDESTPTLSLARRGPFGGLDATVIQVADKLHGRLPELGGHRRWGGPIEAGRRCLSLYSLDDDGRQSQNENACRRWYPPVIVELDVKGSETVSSLEGRVALVTGCARRSGIGRGIARTLALAGADIAVTDVASDGRLNAGEGGERDQDWHGLDSVVAEIEALGRRCLPLVGDVGLRRDADRLIADAAGHLGRLDILVNNAAAPHGGDRAWTWEVPEEAFDEVLRVNAKGVFLMSSAFVRHAVERDASWGRIVNIASVSGLHGFPQRAAYTASKFAAVGMTQVMAAELAERGITVNAVCPGAVDTPRHSARTARASATDEASASIVLPPSPAAVGRLGTPDDIARAVLFLAEPAAGFITGQSLVVDGGGIVWH